MTDGTGAVQSMDIMTLRTTMVRMEKINSFLAQRRSSAAWWPRQVMYSQDRPNPVATARVR